MKTTVDIPDKLFREAKSVAALRGSKLKDLVADGLRLVLNQKPKQAASVRFPLFPLRAGAKRLTAAKVEQIIASEDRAIDDAYARPRRR